MLNRRRDLFDAHIGTFNQHCPAGSPDECWEWQGTLDRYGYGRITAAHNGKYVNVGAHRVAYLLHVGDVDGELVLDHTCHDAATCAGGPTCQHRRCVNPSHLEPVTNAANLARTAAERTTCTAEHQRNAENTRVVNGRRVCRVCEREALKRWRESSETWAAYRVQANAKRREAYARNVAAGQHWTVARRAGSTTKA